MTDNTSTYPDFGLIETILWEQGSYFLLTLHFERLEKSAVFFGFRYNKKPLLQSLEKNSHIFNPEEKYRVRLVLEKSGEYSITSNMLSSSIEIPVKTTFSEKETDKKNVFLYHKTTNRELYDTELKKYRGKGFFDIIFMNKQKEITEGAITNILIQKNGKYFTPPLSSGALDGVYLKHLLQTNKFNITVKTLYREDIVSSDKIFLVNSVRKILPAILIN